MSETGVETTQKLDELIGEIRELSRAVRDVVPNTTNTTNIGGGGDGFRTGALIGVCIATCIATWVGLIIGALVLTNLMAWRDVHSNDIGKLKADYSQLKETRK